MIKKFHVKYKNIIIFLLNTNLFKNIDIWKYNFIKKNLLI